MKKLLFFFFILPISFYGQKWVLSLEENNNKTYISNSIEPEYVWVKHVSKRIEFYVGNAKKFIDGYKILRYKYDCKNRAIGIGRIIIYDKSGNIVKQSGSDDLIELDSVVPDSIGEDLLNDICFLKKNEKLFDSYHSLNPDITKDVFLNSYRIFGQEYIDFINREINQEAD